jgi:hypothetical protein
MTRNRKRRPKTNFMNCWSISTCLKNDEKLMMGSTNAKVGWEILHLTVIGHYSLPWKYQRKRPPIDRLCCRWSKARTSYFMLKRIHLETLHSPDGRTRNQNNHSLFDVKARRVAILIQTTMLIVKKWGTVQNMPGMQHESTTEASPHSTAMSWSRKFRVFH